MYFIGMKGLQLNCGFFAEFTLSGKL